MIEEFAKSRVIRAYVLTWSTCQHGLRANVLAWQRGLCANVPACQRAKSVPVSHFYVSRCQWMCQRAIRRANVLAWRANVPNGVPIFQLGLPTCQKACQFFRHSSYEMLSEIQILHFIIVIHVICICIVNKNFILTHSILHDFLSYYIVWDFFFFIIFFFVAL